MAAMSMVPPAFGWKHKKDFLKAVLLHPGQNMWGDWRADGEPFIDGLVYAADHIRFDEAVWRKCVDHAAEKGLNAVVIDLGEWMQFPSHPELAVKGSWTAEAVRAELARMRKLGLEPLPKLNFSAGHDSWLKEYHRMVGTSRYYEVCRDLIRDVAEIFDHPRYLHIGFDEEESKHQYTYAYVVVRLKELWWHDLKFFTDTIEKNGMRPWMWSDYWWHHPDTIKRCPRDIVHSNWYYDERCAGFDLATVADKERNMLELFEKLDKIGCDQIPCSSNWMSPFRTEHKIKNTNAIGGLYEFTRKIIGPNAFLGYMATAWGSCTQESLEINLETIDQIAAAVGNNA